MDEFSPLIQKKSILRAEGPRGWMNFPRLSRNLFIHPADSAQTALEDEFIAPRRFIHPRGPLMSGQAAEPAGSRKFIHPGAMPVWIRIAGVHPPFIYSSSAEVAHALALQVQQAFHLFIPASTHFIILGVRPLSPFIYPSAALKLLERVEQVTHARFIYSSAALKLLERVEQVTHARFIYLF